MEHPPERGSGDEEARSVGAPSPGGGRARSVGIPTARVPRLPHRHAAGAYLFVPANRAGFLTRLPLVSATAVILDLEYATRWPQKNEARYLAAEAIGYLRGLSPEMNVTVRVNMPSAGDLALRDIDVVAPARPDALRIPAVEDASELRRLCDRVGEIERREGLSEGSIRFHPMIESPKGLVNAAAIASASPRNEALCLGGEDWAHSVGALRTRSGDELAFVRAALVATAAEHRLVAVDTVYTWLDDLEGLALDCMRSRELGFRGRATVHPRQIDVIRRAYRPEPEAVERARSLLESLTEISVDGARLHLANGVITDPRAIFQARLTCLSAGVPS